MIKKDVLNKNKNFYIGIICTVLEGMLSGCIFILLYSVMQSLWFGNFDFHHSLTLTGILVTVLAIQRLKLEGLRSAEIFVCF